MKRSMFLIFALLFSFSTLAHHEDAVTGNLDSEYQALDSSRIHLGYLEGEMGRPFHKEMMFTRTADTPKKVTLSFFYTQIEMICEDRVSDGGGYGGYYSRANGNIGINKSTNKYYGYRGGHHSFGGGYGHGYGGGYENYGYDRNFLGICSKWTEMETEKSGRIGLFFKRRMKGDMETIKIMLTRRDRHSTSFYFDADILTPSRSYTKRRMNSRAIMWK